jgi:hypothetical protein
MDRLLLAAAAVASGLATAGTATADPGQFLNFFVTPATYSGCEDPSVDWIDSASCEDLVSTPFPEPAYAWVVASDLNGFSNGIGGVQFGIEHDRTITFWYLCTGGLQILEEGWPASGTGMAATWEDGCYHPAGDNAKIGFFYIADGNIGHLTLTPDPRIGAAQFADCGMRLSTVCATNLGSIELAAGGTPRCTPGPLVAPANCAATDEGCFVFVSWQHDGDGVAQFRVFKDGEPFATVERSARTVVDSTLHLGDLPTYFVTASAGPGCVESPPSNGDTGQITEYLAPAENCQATNDRCDEIVVTWEDHSDNELGFKVLRGGEEVGFAPVNATSFTDLTAPLRVLHEYEIVMSAACGDAPPSNADQGFAETAPAEPGSCTASDGLCRIVLVEWQDRSFNESGFRVLRDGVILASLPPNRSSYTDATAPVDVPGTYQVVAWNACDEVASNEDIGTAGDDPPLPPATCTASSTLCPHIRVCWTDSSRDESGFLVFRDGTLLATLGAGQTCYNDTSAVIEIPYTYWVVATSPCGTSDPSPSDEGIRPDPPLPGVPELIEPDEGAPCVPRPTRFRWHRASDATGYALSVSPYSCTGNGTETADTTATVSLSPNTTYHWRVRAKNLCNEWGEWSTCRVFTTAPRLPPPGGFTATELLDRTWLFAWQPLTGSEYYVLSIGTTCYDTGPGTVTFQVAGRDTVIDVAGLGYSEFGSWVAGVICETRGTASMCRTGTADDGTTPTHLEYFRVVPAGSIATIEWAPAGAGSVSGYHVYRRNLSTTEPEIRLNEALIPGGETEVSFTDRTVPRAGVYRYRLAQVDRFGGETTLGEIDVTLTLAPQVVSLAPIRPNPSQSSVALSFGLPARARVAIDVFDTSGRRVRRLAESTFEAGFHELGWDGLAASGLRAGSGRYFVRLQVGEVTRVRSLLLVR